MEYSDKSRPFEDVPCRFVRPNPFQTMRLDGTTITIKRGAYPVETHEFESIDEAAARLAIVEEAFSWIGTPFINCGDIKGRAGAIDCAMLLVRCYVDTGRLAPFDPRPYPADWMLHNSDEKFLGWIVDQLGGIEVETPRLGDVAVWQFGRCFSHGGIVVNSMDVVHAFSNAGSCIISRMDSEFLKKNDRWPRPVKYFEVRAPHG